MFYFTCNHGLKLDHVSLPRSIVSAIDTRLFVWVEQKVVTEVSELEHIGELGHGSCGHVVKMRHRKTGVLMAVKVWLCCHIFMVAESSSLELVPSCS